MALDITPDRLAFWNIDTRAGCRAGRICDHGGAEFCRPANRDAHRPLTQHFTDQLSAAVRRLASPVVVGLDPRWEQLPDALRAGGDASWDAQAAAYAAFCNGVIDVVAPLVPAVKIQAAFFEELGPAGMTAMASVDRPRPRARPAGDPRRQAERHRQHGRGLRPRLSRPRRSAWHADALTDQPVSRRRQPHAVCRSGDGARRRLVRAGEDVEPRQRHAAGSGGRRQEALSPRGAARRTAGDRNGRRVRLRQRRRGRRRDVSRAARRAAGRDAAHLVPRARLRQPGRHGGRRGRGVRRPRPRRDRQQLARHHLRPFAPRVCRPLRRRAVAGSGRGGDARDDRPAARGGEGIVARLRTGRRERQGNDGDPILSGVLSIVAHKTLWNSKQNGFCRRDFGRCGS